ncbi:hypothetical protein ACFFRR_001297 [Megaselia abdita]
MLALGGNQYWIEELKNSSGLYQENLGTVHVSTDSWKFDIVINLSRFREDADKLLKSINSTKTQCQSDKVTLGCQAIAKELLHREILLENRLQELYFIFHPSQRNKRDILDKVGSAHALLGIMDADDSKKIYKAIDELTADNSAVFEEICQHRSTINSIVRAFNATTEEINENFKTIKTKLMII